ncbi:unnamed protein product [Allacma fusca]|uniref:Gamma-interferon-inducible lysosomal thiol reductase n=1 Tax=Allacma fusca TaxID=39272 RepID=A0A8J2K3V0_9HEXA|nr:unnamed protein product [Allacma fusca]
MNIVAFFSQLACSFGLCLDDTPEPKLKVSVYYETLCPHSIKFIRDQLYPVYEELREYLELDLVPYGNAETIRHPNGTVQFWCQHGTSECFGNTVHACAISLLAPEVSAFFIYCTMYQRPPSLAGSFCAKELNITFAPIRNCARSNEGKRLHERNGNRTAALVPYQKWVPWITFNDGWDENDDGLSSVNFLAVVCKHLRATQPSALETGLTMTEDQNRVKYLKACGRL